MKLLDYIKGDRKGKEAHRLEKEAMDDPFLAEAMEGFDAVEGDHGQAVERLRERIVRRSASRRKGRWLWALGSAAALLLLFLVIGNRGWFRDYDEGITPILAQIADIEKTDTVKQERQAAVDSISQKQAGDSAKQPETVAALNLRILPDDQKITEPQEFADFEESVEFSFSPVPAEERAPEQLQKEIIPQQAIAAQAAAAFSDKPAGQVPETAAIRIGSTSSIATRSASRLTAGQVVDGQGHPLPGVTVSVPGGWTGATTDSQGRFILSDAIPGQRVEASFAGYEPAVAVVPADTAPLLIALNESEQLLEDAVTVASGTASRKAVTGNAAAISGESSALPEKVIPYAVPAERPDAFSSYIEKNRIPQYDAAGEKITGKVVLEFRVNRQGRPAAIRIIENLSPEADAEAVRLLENSPGWQPAGGRVKVELFFR